MAKAIRVHEVGGPEVLRWEEVDVPAPAAGELQIRHTAVGLNFIDTYFRTGLYPAPLPLVLGQEAAGVVVAVGAGVEGFAAGDRVAYGTGPLGAYAEVRNLPALHVVKVSAEVDDTVAAAVMLKGMTAHYLLEMGGLVGSEQRPTVLVHAAAGGVGSLLSQWASHAGATVIGTAGDEEKAKLARENGCTHVILYRSEDVAAQVKELTGGKLCDVVYDSVGKDMFAASLASVRPRGLFVSYGNSSGAVPAFEPKVLASAGSVFFTRPRLNDYAASAEEIRRRAGDLFASIGSGILKIRVAQTYALADAGAAQRDLEARKTTGSTVLLP